MARERSGTSHGPFAAEPRTDPHDATPGDTRDTHARACLARSPGPPGNPPAECTTGKRPAAVRRTALRAPTGPCTRDSDGDEEAERGERRATRPHSPSGGPRLPSTSPQLPVTRSPSTASA
jgi:hypothetical protein